jgi:hypothetical protein
LLAMEIFPGAEQADVVNKLLVFFRFTALHGAPRLLATYSASNSASAR